MEGEPGKIILGDLGGVWLYRWQKVISLLTVSALSFQDRMQVFYLLH